MIGAPPKSATAEFLDMLERARRLTGLQVNTLTMAVVDVDDTVGWTRLTELGTSSTITAQTTATTATTALLNATLQAVNMVGDVANLPGVQPGRLASGRDVRGMFAATQGVVRNRVTGGATFPEALTASAHFLTGVASSEPYRIGRDGQMNTGLADSRFDRFRRVAEPGACDWCRMLATRGAVYLTEQSAGKGRAYHLPRDRCHVELVVNAKAIADSKSLSGDWRNAIRDHQRMVDAGAMDGITTDAQAWMKTGGWQRGKWVEVTPDEALFGGLPEHLAATLREKRDLTAKFDALRAKPKTPRPVLHALANGNKTIVSEQSLSKSQLDGLLADLDEAIAAMPDDLRSRGVSLMVPVGDPKFKSGAGGYVIGGSPRIYVKPAIAQGSETWENPAMGRPVDGIQYGHRMPASTPARTRRDVVMHEMGHVVDGMKQHTGVKWSEEAFWTQNVDRLPARMYAQKNAAEGYAEAFFQYHVGGPGSTPISDAYAARYGW